jgi:hypothetical protein
VRDRSCLRREQAREEVVSWQQGGCEPGVSLLQGLEAGTYSHGKLGPDLVNGIAHLYGWVEACRIEAVDADTAAEEGRNAAVGEEGGVAAGRESWTVLASEGRNVSSRFSVRLYRCL